VSAVRDRLRFELAAKVERHGVVIWDDPDGAYSEVVSDVAPKRAAVHSFAGSWFSLRRQVEPLLAGQGPPSLVVYVPQRRADPDPLEELRAFGARFRVTLPTLLKKSLVGQLTEQRITQIGQQCATLREAEAVLESGDSSVDARLISIVGDSSVNVIAAHVLSGAHLAELEQRGLDDLVRTTLSESFGVTLGQVAGSDLRAAAFRQVALTVIHSATESLPDELAASFQPPTATQRKTCAAVVDFLQVDPGFRDEYVNLAEQTDVQLHLGALLPWHDALMSVDATPVIERSDRKLWPPGPKRLRGGIEDRYRAT
jgi:hypothetical protein